MFPILDINRSQGKVAFSINGDIRAVQRFLSLIYASIFGYITLTAVIPAYFRGSISILETVGSIIFFTVISALFVLVILPPLIRLSSKRTKDFIVLDTSSHTLFFRMEDVKFDTNKLQKLLLEENRNIFGVQYYLVVQTADMKKSIMPPLAYKIASQILEVLQQEIKSGK